MPQGSTALASTSIYSRLCRDCIIGQRNGIGRSGTLASQVRATTPRRRPRHRSVTQTRAIHHGKVHQLEAVAATTSAGGEVLQEITQLPIRERLAKWQEENGNPMSDLIGIDTAFGIRNVVADSYGEAKETESEAQENREHDDDYGLPVAQYDQDVSQYGYLYLQMGDLAELKSSRPHAPPTLCIYVRMLPASKQIQLITMRGKWVAVKEHAVQFSIPRFVDPKLVQPIVPYLPDEDVLEEVLGQTHILDPSVPRDVTAPVITALNKFNQASEEVYRKHAAVLDTAHDIVAHPTDLRFGTLDRITNLLIKADSGADRMATMYAVRKAIVGAGMGFGVDKRNHRTTGVFQIRSKEQLQYVTTAVEWLRQFQEYVVAKELSNDPSSVRCPPGARIVQKFVDKAKRAVLECREHRSAQYIAYGGLGPSDRRYSITSKHGTLRFIPSVEFDDNDRVLIRVLEYSGVQNIIDTEEALPALLPLILRATGLYTQKDDETTLTLGKRGIYAFLIELGVLAPFEDITKYDVNLLLPSSQHSKPLQQLASELELLNMSKVNLKDSFADLRKDLKGTTAFAIDAAGSQEIDDAISITRIPGDDSKAWCHIHIANPTAFISRDSRISRMAAHLTESFYAPDQVIPLLPWFLSKEMFSLDSGRPCLTVSALIDEAGDILDVNLEHGKLGTVVPIAYSQLPEILGIDAPDEVREPMIVGGKLDEPPAPPKFLSFTDAHRDDLKLLNKFAIARSRLRIRNGGFPYTYKPPEVNVHNRTNQFGLDLMYPRRRRAARVDGDPIISIQPLKFENPFMFAEEGRITLVQEMMLAAGEAFSRWCHRRNIPLAYRSMRSTPGMPSYQDAHQKYIQTALDKYGHIPIGKGFQFLSETGRGSMSTKPAKHPSLGLELYTKITSPLRRYGDMLAHWQAEAALRQEARFGHDSLLSRTALASQSQDYLPFNDQQMNNIISRLHPRETLISSSKRRCERHWMTQWWFRAHYFQEWPLPKTFEVTVLRPAQSYSSFRNAMNMCVSNDYGMMLKMASTEFLEMDVQHGDIWEAEVDFVAPYFPDTVVKPVALKYRENGG